MALHLCRLAEIEMGIINPLAKFNQPLKVTLRFDRPLGLQI